MKFIKKNVRLAETRSDLAEYVTDLGTEQSKNGDYDNGYQYEYERVFNQTLTVFTM